MSGGPPVPGGGGRSDDARERARRAREARRARSVGTGHDAAARARAGSRSAAVDREPPDRGNGHAAYPAEDRAPARRPRSTDPASVRTRGRRRGLAVLGAAMLAGTLVVAWALVSYYQPFTGEGEGRVRVQIPNGASVSQIAEILESRGVISSPFFFRTRARLTGRGTTLRPGAYTLAAGASNASVLDVLAAGPPPDVVSVTVPEGGSREEVAPIVAGAGLGRGYRRATAGALEGFDPASYGAPEGSSLEGFLFPSTYELRRSDDARDLVRRQTAAFAREAREVGLEGGPEGRTPYEILTVASMVEREAQLDRERPLIASVIYNRLEVDQPLQIDATVRYASGNWTSPIKQSELASPSPFNTYANPGLPPGPIGSPGHESIEAAVNPADTDYRFYVVKPGTCGEHAFSDNDQQWARDNARYKAEREARGGRSPTDC